MEHATSYGFGGLVYWAEYLGGQSVMKAHRRSWVITLVLLSALGLVVYSGVAADETSVDKSEPAYVEPIEGSSLSRIVLSEQAAQRIGLATAPVADDASNGVPRKVIPYAAVIYSPNGETWAYTSPEPRVFVREAIAVDRIEGDKAILTEGPAAGTEVVTVGAAELLGAESGLGH
jgi:hypothetical protein